MCCPTHILRLTWWWSFAIFLTTPRSAHLRCAMRGSVSLTRAGLILNPRSAVRETFVIKYWMRPCIRWWSTSTIGKFMWFPPHHIRTTKRDALDSSLLIYLFWGTQTTLEHIPRLSRRRPKSVQMPSDRRRRFWWVATDSKSRPR